MKDIEDMGYNSYTVLENIIRELCGIVTESSDIHSHMRKIVRKHKYKGGYPSKDTMRSVYRSLIQSGSIDSNSIFESKIVSKAVRSASGVNPVTTVMKPDAFSCKKDCYYCPDERKINGAEYDMPRSYESSEPAVKRAMQSDWFDCYTQVTSRLQTLEKNGHTIDKIEHIVEGGSFSHYKRSYQEEYVRDLFYSCNVYNGDKRPRKSLEEEKKINESARVRVIGIVLETRPDCINKHEIRRLRRYGCTRVQMGVQHTDNAVLSYVNRGHTVEQSIKAMELLKDNCFKVDIHLMPDLPSSTPDKDKRMFDFIFDTPYLRADYCKIYPCLDVPYTKIREWKRSGKWKPYTEENGGEYLIDVLLYMKRKIPRYLRINRLQRDFPESHINNKYIGFESANHKSNLRQILLERMANNGEKCLCIRCREVGLRVTDRSKAVLTIQKYKSSNGWEFFISFRDIDQDILYGFVRLRFPSNMSVFPELTSNTALIRELHVYGAVASVNSKDRKKTQHQGFGKRLMIAAENIASKSGYKNIAVISGVGVRDYYRKLGYNLEGTGEFMFKTLPSPEQEENNYMTCICILLLSIIIWYLFLNYVMYA